MTCPRCQQDNPTHARFCLGCGTRLTLACGACGAELPGGAHFCLQCGQAVARSAAAPIRSPTPETYTPKHLAEKILTSKAALEGERKQVTVLFADLKGSMELLADRDPEEARQLLDPVLERMMEAVHRYEGTVNQVMGDGIMALFGAPLAHEDHAVRACYAALDMQAAMRRYAEAVRRSHGISLEIRVGLNSGQVVVRAIGSDLHMDYTAVGQTTHLAARMEQLATGGRSLLTADTLRLVEGYVDVKSLGPVPVKGLEAAIEVYEILGAGPLRSRFQAAAARGLTRFVGRETEVEQLRQALGRAAAGHGQLAALVGEPGVGKSRLVWEVIHSHRTHGWLTVQASSVSYGKATLYLPVIDLLKGYLRIQDQDDPRAVREKVTGKLLTLDEALKPTVPAFLALLDVPVDDAAWSVLDPSQRRQRTLEALKRLLLRESQVQPLLVVFEDLHWVDGETQAFLDSLVESLPAARMLLLVNYRPEYTHRWGSKTYYTQLRLDPLPPESAEALLDALLGSDPALRPLKHLLIARTEGNPFFLEESVRTLVETKGLAGERGAYRLAHALPSIQVPATVQAVLAARIDRLAAEEKRLLQAAAVIGKDVPFAILQTIAEGPGDVLRHNLATLQAGEFLHEARLFPDLEYTFKHALTHEVAYGSLLQERRRALHARIVDAIEGLYPDRLAEHVDRLAHHALRAELSDKAVTYLHQAGVRAVGRGAAREARAFLEQAIALLDPLPEQRSTRELAVDLRLEVQGPLALLGEVERGLVYLHEAKALAESLGDRFRLGCVLSELSEWLWIVGDLDRAAEAGHEAQRFAETVADPALQARVGVAVGITTHALGQYRQSVAALEAALRHLDRASGRNFGTIRPPAVICCTWLAFALSDLGRLAEAWARSNEAMAVAESLGQPNTLITTCGCTGYLHARFGDPARGIAPLERALAISQTLEDAGWGIWINTYLGYAYAAVGRFDHAVPLLERALQLEASNRYLPNQSWMLCFLGEAYLFGGRLSEASTIAERALRVARTRQARGHESQALWLTGEITFHRDPGAGRDSETYYRDALTLADELGMRPLAAHCHLGLGKLYRQTHDRAKADEHLATATTMYREMGMTFWLEKAHAELGGVER